MSLANLAQRTAGAVALGDAEERWRCGKFWEPIIAEYLLYNLTFIFIIIYYFIFLLDFYVLLFDFLCHIGVFYHIIFLNLFFILFDFLYIKLYFFPSINLCFVA